MKRDTALDGIRGLMAINVVICHFVCAFYPEMYFVDKASGGGILAVFSYSPLSALVNGNIAVQFFFCLSGYLTAVSVFLKKETTVLEIVKKCVGRYLRLLPMVIAATFFSYILMKFGLMYHQNIIGVLRNGEFYSSYNSFTPSLLDSIYNAFVLTFIKSNSYVGPFWTVRYELFGYIVCLIMCTLLKGEKYRRICYILVECILCVINIDFYYVLPFILGVYVADFLIYKEKDTTYFSKYYKKIINLKGTLCIITVVGVYLASIPMFYAGIHKPLGFVPQIPTSAYRCVGVALLLYMFQLKDYSFKQLLRGKFMQFLGRISFPIYAFHWPLMLSVQAKLFSVLIISMDYNIASLLAFFVNLVLIVAVSCLAWYLIERPNLSGKVLNLIFKRRINS